MGHQLGLFEQSEVLKKLEDAEVPGSEVSFDPDEADAVGVFTEDAIGESDALQSVYDSTPSIFGYEA